MIELLGLPGCGKSTYIKSHPMDESVNPSDLIYNNNHWLQNINKIPLIFYLCLLHPALSAKITMNMAAINYTSFFRRIKMFTYLFSTLGAIEKTKRKYDFDKIRIDEGVNQVLAFVLYESIGAIKYIDRLWTLLTPFMAKEIVYFDVKHYTIKQRLLARSGRYGSEVQRDLLKNQDAIMEADKCIRHILFLIRNNGMKVTVVE